ncbi:MAG: hypothetical protein NTW94_09880 [Legionellales bacterium]|nr:hypothetical protein [Legionellales bacterium]
MKISNLNKAYVSPFDRFLFEFDAAHEKSVSQLEEIKKHQRIAALRDKACLKKQPEKIWHAF